MGAVAKSYKRKGFLTAPSAALRSSRRYSARSSKTGHLAALALWPCSWPQFSRAIGAGRQSKGQRRGARAEVEEATDAAAGANKEPVAGMPGRGSPA